MRKPLEARRAGLRQPSAAGSYDEGRRAACTALLAGPVRSGAARRLVELVLAPREHRDELGEIFDAADRLGRAPSLGELTVLAGRATAAHTCRGARSLGASVAAISAGLDRRFSACEAGEAGYPLSLAGLGAAGRYGLENHLSAVYLTHTLERIVESAILLGTVIEPACAPGAYSVSFEPRACTAAEVRSLLAGRLARHQNATIAFALEELTSRYRREPIAVDHLQYLLLAVRAPVDIQRLVVEAHALMSAACDDVDIDMEIWATAGILDGSGLSAEGSLALGEAVGALTSLAAGLVSSLHAATSGAESLPGGNVFPGAGSGVLPRGGAGLPVESWPSRGAQRSVAGRGSLAGRHCDAGDLARSVFRVALVIAWCAHHGRVRPGAITIDDAPGTGY